MRKHSLICILDCLRVFWINTIKKKPSFSSAVNSCPTFGRSTILKLNRFRRLTIIFMLPSVNTFIPSQYMISLLAFILITIRFCRNILLCFALEALSPSQSYPHSFPLMKIYAYIFATESLCSF